MSQRQGNLIKLIPAIHLSESTMRLLLQIAWVELKKRPNLKTGIRISLVLEAERGPSWVSKHFLEITDSNHDMPMLKFSLLAPSR